MAGLGDGGEAVGGLRGEDAEVHGLASPTGAAAASNRASQSMSSRSRRMRFDSRSTRAKAPRYQAASRSCGEGERRVRLDHRQRRPQLVRGVRGELQLAAAGGLDRRRDAPADDDRADEHRAEQERRDEQHADDDRPLRVADLLHGLGDDHAARPPTSWPATRISVPSIVAVTGAVDGRAARRAGRASSSPVETVPSVGDDPDEERRAERPARDRARATGASPPGCRPGNPSGGTRSKGLGQPRVDLRRSGRASRTRPPPPRSAT